MVYVLETITDDDVSKILADAKSDPDVHLPVNNEYWRERIDRDGRSRWAIDRQENSYLFCSRYDNKSCYARFWFFYKHKIWIVYMNLIRASARRKHIRGWVSLDATFSSSPPEDVDFQKNFTEAYEVLYAEENRKRPELYPEPVFNDKEGMAQEWTTPYV
ncbi:MAG: hypothetical protein LBU53_01275 [Zoogloeaceae bacterium]|nr:hypothetical protein [Zoogloeaceae bacterium]